MAIASQRQQLMRADASVDDVAAAASWLQSSLIFVGSEERRTLRPVKRSDAFLNVRRVKNNNYIVQISDMFALD